MNDLRIAFECPNCHANNDRHGSASEGTHNSMPRHHDVSVCWNCKVPGVFEQTPEGLVLVKWEDSTLSPEAREQLQQLVDKMLASSADLVDPMDAVQIAHSSLTDGSKAVVRFFEDEDYRHMLFEYVHDVEEQGWPPYERVMIATPIRNPVVMLMLASKLGPDFDNALVIGDTEEADWREVVGEFVQAYDLVWFRRTAYGNGESPFPGIAAVKGAKYVREAVDG